LVSLYSTMEMMHGPVNIRCMLLFGGWLFGVCTIMQGNKYSHCVAFVAVSDREMSLHVYTRSKRRGKETQSSRDGSTFVFLTSVPRFK